MHTNFLTMIAISSFYCCEKVLSLWIYGCLGKIKWNIIIWSFFSHVNTEDITDTDYVHAKRVCKDFEIKKLGEYQDLYVQSDMSLLGDVFEYFRNMFLEIYEIDPAKFF